MLKTLVLAISCFAVADLSHGQQLAKIFPHKINTEIKVDGRLAEPEWQLTPELNEFIQSYPDLGGHPSFLTTARILYNENYFYIGIMAYDSMPGSLLGSTMERDIYFKNEDHINLLLDTYNDKMNALVFSANTVDSRFDEESIGNGGGYNSSFNTFWDVKSHISDSGYSMEFRIPLSSLRFQRKDLVEMGFKIVRLVARKNEYDIFPKADSNLSNLTWRTDITQTLVFEGLTNKKPFYVTPYVSLNYFEQKKLNNSSTAYYSEKTFLKENHYSRTRSLDKMLSNTGADVKYGLSKNFTLDATWNTDFAQAEVDTRVVSLNRFNVFLPEKRSFFLESANYLSFNVSGDYNTGSFISLFNSRNIGIENGLVVPVAAGLRLTGRSRGYQIGMLEMQTKGIPGSGIDPQNFSAFRVRKELYGNGSFVGMMVTNRVSTTNSHALSNQAFGIDFYRKYNPQWSLALNAANTNDIKAGKFGINTGTYNVTVSRNVSLGYSGVYSITYSGQNFHPLSGFYSDSGFVDFTGYHDYTWQPRNRKKIAYYDLFSVLYDRYRISQKKWDYHDFYLYETVCFTNGSVIRGIINLNREFIPYTWAFSINITLPQQYYSNQLFLVKYESHKTGKFFYEARFGGGKLYNGRRIYTDPDLKIYLSKYFNLNAGTVMNFIKFPSQYAFNGKTSYSNILLLAGFTFTASPVLSLKILAQYDNISHNLEINGRFRYNPKEGTDLYIVYTPSCYFPGEVMTPVPPRVMSQNLTLKYSKTFNIKFK